MQEMIKNAGIGWKDYTTEGKLAAFFLAALLFLWIVNGKNKGSGEDGKHKVTDTLVLFASFLAILCICPWTAAVLMYYQTRFYDYQWIWNMVPMTIVIALAATKLIMKVGKSRGKRISTTLLVCVILFLAGSMGEQNKDGMLKAESCEKTEALLQVMKATEQEQEITLWAPQEIMASVRLLDATVKLPYGRNMWDPALNAYSFDCYGEQEQCLYQWMSWMEMGEGSVLSESDSVVQGKEEMTVTSCVEILEQLKVSHIALPASIEKARLEEFEKVLGVKATQVQDYYLLQRI